MSPPTPSTTSPATPTISSHEEAWIRDALETSIRLSNVIPTSKLQRHAETFAGLSKQFQLLAAQMTPPPESHSFELPTDIEPLQRSASLASSARSLSPTPELSSSTRQTPAPEGAPLVDEAAKELLKHAMKRMTSILHHVGSLDARTPRWHPQSSRITHLRAITSHNIHGKTPAQKWVDRLLMICACQSLASDLRDYETRHGLKPKQDILIKRISARRDPAAHRIADHLSGYISTRVEEIDKDSVRQGLRFGVKLNVIEQMGVSLGLGLSLSLLFGHDTKRVFRLPYQSIISLESAIRNDEAVLASLSNFSRKVDSWWKNCQSQYHERFADAKNGAAADPLRLSSASPRMPGWNGSVPDRPATTEGILHPTFSEGFALPSQWNRSDGNMGMNAGMGMGCNMDMGMQTPPAQWSSPQFNSYQNTPLGTPFEFGDAMPVLSSQGFGDLGLNNMTGYFDMAPDSQWGSDYQY